MQILKKTISVLLALTFLFCACISAHAASIEDWESKWDAAVSNETVVSLSPGSDESQMNFCWLAPLGSNAAFRCGKNDALSDADSVKVKTSPAITGQLRCVVTVNGLKPDSVYYYSYALNGKWSKTFAFKTPGETLTALFVSDSQLGRSGDWRDKNVLLHDVAGWDTTLCEAMAAFPEISLCLSAGDQAEIGFSEKQYRLLLAPDVMRALPIATTIGNHEFYFPQLYLHFAQPNRFCGSILHSFGDEPYYFMQKDVLFVVLDTNDPIAWDHVVLLEKAINAYPDAKWRVVMMHHSLYSCENSFEEAPTLRKSLAPLLQKYGVDLVLSGHTHRFSRSYPLWDDAVSDSGIIYLEGGCCSGCNCKPSPESLPEYTAAGYSKTDPVYSVLRFEEDKIILRSFAVENGQSVQIDQSSVSSRQRDDESARSSSFMRFIHGVLSVFGRAVSVLFR